MSYSKVKGAATHVTPVFLDRGGEIMTALGQSAAFRWTAGGAALVAVMLVLPLLLFAGLSYWKLGFLHWSYYVPYEEFGQNLAAGDLRKIYYAPLIAVNVTSGFVIANMFTYTLGHTLVTLLLVALVLLYVAAALRRARVCAARVSATPAGGAAAAGVFAATAASSSAALTGCCGVGMAGGLVALAGFGSVAGAWAADAASYAQGLLVLGLGVALIRGRRKEQRADTQAGKRVMFENPITPHPFRR
jgi:hypothetical protein